MQALVNHIRGKGMENWCGGHLSVPDVLFRCKAVPLQLGSKEGTEGKVVLATVWLRDLSRPYTAHHTGVTPFPGPDC